MQTAIVIMSKIPQPGFTKTRLKSKLADQECADFHRACLLDICRAVRMSGLPGFIYFTVPFTPKGRKHNAVNHNNYWDMPAEDHTYFIWRPQQGDDLGQRLFHAVQETLHQYEAVVLVGSDMPELSPALLLEAQARLADQDVVIGPASDGGYYLLGIKRSDPHLFQDIPWGTERVLENTLERIRERNYSMAGLELKSDIDTWDDVVSFYQQGQGKKSLAYPEWSAYTLAEKLVDKYGI